MTGSRVLGPNGAPVIDLQCASWGEFYATYANELAHGRVCLRKPQLARLAPGTRLQLRMQLPDTIELAVNALVSESRAAAAVWVELIERDAEWQDQLAQLIEFARAQSETGRATGNFARPLVETQSLPPSELAQRLSPAAAGSSSRDAAHASRTGLPAQSQSGTRSSRTNMPAVRGASQPLATSSSRTDMPTVRAPSQPLAAATRTSRPNMPAVRAPSQPLHANNTSGSRPNVPAVRPVSQPLATNGRASQTHMPAVRAPSQPLHASATSASQTQLPAVNGHAQPQAAPGTPPKPTNPLDLKRLLTEVAHKRYDAAIKVAQDMLRDNPGDGQAERWQQVCLARLAVARNEPAVACKHYEQVLSSDPNDREAREFVRTHRRDEKLNALPFGRFFTTKRKP